MADDDTKFQAAYKELQADKREARRLQSLLARLTEARIGAEEKIDGEVGAANIAHAEAVATADERLAGLLAVAERARRLVHEDIADSERGLERVRKRLGGRGESLFSLLNDDLRQQ